MDIKESEPSIQKVDTKVSTIVDQIKNVLKGEQLTSENILKLTANTIKITEKLKDTTGVEKKTILLQSLSSIVDNQDIGDEKK